MWNYKNFYLLILVYWALAVVSYIVGFSSDFRYTWYANLPYYCSATIHVLIDLSIITTLTRYKENWWRTVPFYILILEEVLTFIWTRHSMSGDPKSMYQFHAIVGLTSCILCFYVFVNMLLVKSKPIAPLLKLYGVALLTGITLVLFLPSLYLLYFKGIRVVVELLYKLLFTVHTVPLFILYFRLHKGASTFKPGDVITSKIAFENIAIGTKGVVATKHVGAFYEVEFLDGHSNLLNVLTVAASDITHYEEPDLFTRINSFGA